MIAAHDVTVVLGGKARVAEANLSVAPGEVVALVGPNGAGKSTLLAALSGDHPLAHGEVRLGGRPLDAWARRDRARHLLVLPQAPEAALGLSAADVVGLGPELALGRRAPEAVRAALADVDLVGRAHAPASVLSGGERQRVHLARVLAQARLGPMPAAILLDEPLAAQDPGRVGRVLRLVRRLAHEGHAVLVVLHDLPAASAVADRIVLMVAGEVRAVGRPTEVLTSAVLSRAYGAPLEVREGPGGRPLPLPRLDLEVP